MDTAEITIFRARASQDCGLAVAPDAADPRARLSVLAELEARCVQAVIDVRREAGAITIPASVAQGFAVRVIVADGGYIVCFGNWHTTLASRHQVLRYVEDALAGDVRLKCERIGGKPWRYTVERHDRNGGWTEEDVLEFARFRFGRALSTEYRRNAIAGPFRRPSDPQLSTLPIPG